MSSEKSLTPQIRFKEFTEVWEQRKLQDLFAYGGSGGTPSSNNQDYYNGNIPFLNISDLKERNIRFTEKQITALGLRNSAAWIVPAGSISLAMYASVGKVGIICNDTATSQAFYNMVVQDIFVRNFLYTRLEKADTCNEWEPYISTGTQRNLNAEKVRNFKINIPSIHEMNHIGSIFEVLDSLITLHQRKLDVLKKIKSALLEKMFPKDGSNVPEIRFAGYTEAWEQRKVADIASYTRGGGTPSTSNTAYWNGEIPWIQSSDLSDGKLFGVKPRKHISKAGLSSSATQLVPENSIAVVARVGVGKLAFMSYSYTTSQDFLSLCRLQTKPYFTVYSLYQMLQGELQAVQGTSIKGITKDDLLSKSIFVPNNMNEQQQIGSFFSNLDTLITLHQRKLDALKKIKSALLEKMFV